MFFEILGYRIRNICSAGPPHGLRGSVAQWCIGSFGGLGCGGDCGGTMVAMWQSWCTTVAVVALDLVAMPTTYGDSLIPNVQEIL